MDFETPSFPRLKLGVSSCLLGEKVRYDGRHTRHDYLTGLLAGYADYVSVCPEAGIGMGVPRPPIHLVGSIEHPRALGVADSRMDVTEALTDFAHKQARALDGLDGYIFKKNSPSCGLGKVKLFARPNQSMQRKGTGLYAGVLIKALPLLPVAEEEVFDDPVRRDNFITRVYVYQRWQQLRADGLTASTLIDFHAAHKYLLMARSHAAYRRLGRLLADLSRPRLDTVAQAYITALMPALKRSSLRRQHLNALQHIAGYLKHRLDAKEKSALQQLLADFADEHCDLFTVITALRQAFEKYPDPYIREQVYLHPYPDALRTWPSARVSLKHSSNPSINI